MRKAFAETLAGVAAENSRVIFLTGDLGFQIFDDFQSRFGPRYVNVGVAEAQMVCAAAGLALEGWRPIAYSIAAFITGRAFEQIRVSVCYPQLPVVIVGAGGGFGYSSSGVTHHAGEDLALMSTLPGMTVVAPGDPNEVVSLLPQILRLPGPSYLRIMGVGEPCLPIDEPIVLGRARKLRDGERVGVITTGDLAPVVLQAADLLEAEGISPVVYHLHTVKPLDTAVLDRLGREMEVVIVVEEQIPLGGLGTAVSSWLSRLEKRPKMIRLGVSDALVLGNPRRTELQQRLGYDAPSIARACRSAWKGCGKKRPKVSSVLPGRKEQRKGQPAKIG